MHSRAGRFQLQIKRRSLGADAGKHNRHGAEEDFQIEPEGPVIDVLEIEPDPFAEIGDMIAATDLPQAREARFDAEAAAMREIIEAPDLIDRQRTRANQAHFTAQHVVELRQFIEAFLAQPFANRCATRVVAQLEHGPRHLIEMIEPVFDLLGFNNHRAKLVQHKFSAAQTAAQGESLYPARMGGAAEETGQEGMTVT